MTSSFDRFAFAWVEGVVKYRWAVIVATLVAVVIAASGLPKLGFSSNYRVYFSPTNPDLLAFEDLQATYTKSDNILFVVKPGQGDVFSSEVFAQEVFTPRMLGAIEALTEQAWLLPHASRVDSISNFQHSRADGDDLTVGNLVRDGAAMSPEEVAEKRAIALAEPLLVGNLLSPDASTTGVNVVLHFSEQSLAEVPDTVAAARALARGIEAEYPGIRVALTGVTMLNYAFTESGQRDGATLMPLMYAVLIVLMALTLRSISACLAALAVVGLSSAAALGMAGHLGIVLSPVSVNAPTVILTLAVADSIHILISMLGALREGTEKSKAIRESVRINVMPVSITSVTTLVGFLTLNFSDTPPFHDLGNITAVGIVVALICSLTFLPALLTVLPIRVAVAARAQAGPGVDATGGVSRWLDRFGAWVVRRRRVVLATTTVAVIASISFLPLIDLNDQWVDYFDQRIEFRRDTDFAHQHLTGLYPVEISVPAGQPEGINDPQYLETLERFTAWLREQPEVRHVFSYADIIKRLNKNLHADDPAFYVIPDEGDLAAQYLLLYELSLPFGLDLNDRIAVDKSATRVTATLGDVTTRATRAFLERTEEWFTNHAPPRMHSVPSGPPVMFANISERNIRSMLKGNVLAVVLIAGIMALALRSWRLGLLSLIPNTVPVLMAFGIWGLLVGKVGMAASTMSVCALGIIVDDTVHFLTKYLLARRERGLDRPQAVRYAFRTVGGAILITTVILAAGFLMLALSTFRINFELGLLTAVAIVLALLTDCLLLPALLLWGHRGDKEEITSDETVLTQN